MPLFCRVKKDPPQKTSKVARQSESSEGVVQLNRGGSTRLVFPLPQNGLNCTAHPPHFPNYKRFAILWGGCFSISRYKGWFSMTKRLRPSLYFQVNLMGNLINLIFIARVRTGAMAVDVGGDVEFT